MTFLIHYYQVNLLTVRLEIGNRLPDVCYCTVERIDKEQIESQYKHETPQSVIPFESAENAE